MPRTFRLAAAIWAALGNMAMAGPIAFGFVAVMCGHDDPHDAEARTDYSGEVAGWTSLNHVCLDTPAESTRRLAATRGRFTALLHVEPVFFEGGMRLRWQAAAGALWPVYAEAIRAAGVTPVFYLADEPQLRGLDPALLSRAAQMIRDTFPEARIAVVEAYLPDEPLIIPPEIDLWGFNAYALRDPGADPGYLAQLGRAETALAPHQSLILVADAVFTPVHARAGLRPGDMAEVALAYERLARARPRIAAMIGYTWAGGIDGPEEFGARDLPAEVRETWKAIGLRLSER